MSLVGPPKLAKTLPKPLPRTAVTTLLETVVRDSDLRRETNWAERDLAIILPACWPGGAPKRCKSSVSVTLGCSTTVAL